MTRSVAALADRSATKPTPQMVDQKDQHSGTASLTSWIFILNLHLILALGSLTRLRSLVLSQFTPSRYIA